MKFHPQALHGVFIIEPDVHADERGAFRRHYCRHELMAAGIDFDAVQGNVSENLKAYTLRGFHYSKLPSREDKILSCFSGSAWNVTIDVRFNSPTFKQKMAFEISSADRKSIFIPAGCANAFLTLSDNTVFHYYMGEYYGVASDSGFRFDDPQFSVDWPSVPKVMSKKDSELGNFSLDSPE